jgi:hypothetical protein
MSGPSKSSLTEYRVEEGETLSWMVFTSPTCAFNAVHAVPDDAAAWGCCIISESALSEGIHGVAKSARRPMTKIDALDESLGSFAGGGAGGVVLAS